MNRKGLRSRRDRRQNSTDQLLSYRLATEDTGKVRHYSTQHKSATVIHVQASYRGYR